MLPCVAAGSGVGVKDPAVGGLRPSVAGHSADGDMPGAMVALWPIMGPSPWLSKGCKHPAAAPGSCGCQGEEGTATMGT